MAPGMADIAGKRKLQSPARAQQPNQIASGQVLSHLKMQLPDAMCKAELAALKSCSHLPLLPAVKSLKVEECDVRLEAYPGLKWNAELKGAQ